jgi:hypothetical protein
MKHAIVILLSLVLATAAFAAKEDPGPMDVDARGLLDCTDAPSLSCGQTMNMADPSFGGTVEFYSCTGLNYGQCGEVVYEVCIGAEGTLQIDMTYNHTADNDLDLFLLGSCEENDCIEASLGTSGLESVSAELPAGTYYVVVDGWNDNCDGTGSHDLAVICDVPCTVSGEATSWTNLKSLY